MRPLTALRLMLAAQHLRRLLAPHVDAALDLCAPPFALLVHAACDVADAVGRAMDRRARVRGCAGAECDEPANEAQHMAIPGHAVTVCGRDLAHVIHRGDVGISYPYRPCERVYYTTDRARVTCWQCRDGLVWVREELRREPAPSPRAWPVAPDVLASETPRVGDRYERDRHPTIGWHVTAIYPTCVWLEAPQDWWVCTTAAELADPAGPWRRVTGEEAHDCGCDAGPAVDCGRPDALNAEPCRCDCHRASAHRACASDGCRRGAAPDRTLCAEHLESWAAGDPDDPKPGTAPPTPVTHGAAVVHYSTPDESTPGVAPTPTACGIDFRMPGRPEWTDVPRDVTCPACRRALAPEVLASDEEAAS